MLVKVTQLIHADVPTLKVVSGLGEVVGVVCSPPGVQPAAATAASNVLVTRRPRLGRVYCGSESEWSAINLVNY